MCYSRFIIWMSELVTNTKFLTMSIMDRGERGAGRLYPSPPSTSIMNELWVGMGRDTLREVVTPWCSRPGLSSCDGQAHRWGHAYGGPGGP